MDKLLRISTLGGLSVQLDGEPVTGFISRKVDALLVYLATNPREHPREVLGELLWDDLPQSKTMSYLRTALSSLQKQLAPYLVVTRQTLSINTNSNYWLDISELDPVLDLAEEQWERKGHFSQTVAKQLETVLQYYNGDFLEGFHIRNSRGFEGWMVLTQERLRNRVMEAFFHLGTFALHRGNYSSGIAHTTRALELDPLWEEAHQQLMILYAQSGQRTAALSQFEACKTILDEELGVEPEDATLELYQRILDGQITFTSVPETPNNLPSITTVFIERPDDIRQITQRLDQPECRLLTLVGTGGTGKTRLAIEVASALMPDYPQGVYFVPFSQESNPNLIAKTIAGVLDIDFTGNQPPEDELINYLKDKDILIVLDNLEHLLTGVDVLSRIIEKAPHVKFIATSRVRLNLAEEWLYNVETLAVPQKNDLDVENYPSVQLFFQTAKRVQPDFELALNREPVARICQLVTGLPLAIELAASWVRMLTCEQIFTEIERCIDFLTTSLRNIPERHRSIRAVFVSSWNLLTPDEQSTFCKLAVFRGGFDLQAAQAITGTSVFVISTLVDKSLLSYVDERYEMHDLLRQFAEEKLQESNTDVNEIRNLHSHHYADFIESGRTRLSKYVPRTENASILREYDNIIAAWEYAVETHDTPLLDRFARPIFHLFSLQNDYVGGEEVFRRAAEVINAKSDSPLTPVPIKLLLYRAIFAEYQSNHSDAQKTITKLLPELDEKGMVWEHQLGLRCLGNIEFSKSNYLVAKIYFDQARKVLQDSDEVTDLAEVLFRLSDIEAVTGNYEEAKQLLEQSEFILANAQSSKQHMRYLLTLGDLNYKLGQYDAAEDNFDTALNLSQDFDATRTMAIALASLGRVSHARRKYDEARKFYEQSSDHFQRIRVQWGKGFAILHLGITWHEQGEYARALQCFRQAIAIADEIGSRGIKANALLQKSKSSFELNDVAESKKSIYEALALASEIQAFPLVLDILLGIARLKTHEGNPDDAGRLASYIANNPISYYDARENAAQFLQDLQQHQGIDYEMSDELANMELGKIVEEELNTFNEHS